MSTTEPTARQTQLLDLALELIQEHGLAGLTVRKLAQSAGFSEAALYRHFDSKRSLLRAVARRITDSIIEPVEHLSAEVELPPRERLSRILTHQTRTILTVRGLPILLLAEASATEDDELLRILRTAIGRFIDILGRLVEEARRDQPSEHLPAPSEIAHLLFGLGTATAIRHRLHPDEELEQAATSRLPGFLVDCLLGSSPSTREE